ncbi:DUF2786 domain-containing protein [Streptomyces sp. JNUCC 64]
MYADGDAGLDTGASLLAAAPDADGELVRRGEGFLRDAWRRGWQPADVVRLVRRDLDGPHVRLAVRLIVRETARYERLPPRWDAQLATLRATDGPSGAGDPGGAPGPDARGERGGRGGQDGQDGQDGQGGQGGRGGPGGRGRRGGSPGSDGSTGPDGRAGRSGPGGPGGPGAGGGTGGDGDTGGDADVRSLRDHPDRFSWATAVLELYRLLLRLPAVEPVGPAPGDALPPPTAGESKTLTRIRGLLAKAEATTFPEEAEALSAKAQELMARHSVDEALLAARAPEGAAPGARRIGVDAPYETVKAVLLDTVATANHCRAVWNADLGFSTVVGFGSDLDAVELLYTSLLVQATAAMTRAEGGQRAAGRKRTKTFRQSFLAAYAHRVGDRLTATARRVTATVPDSLPVLAAREVAVADRTDRMFPRTESTRLRGVTDEAGWHEGVRAADRASFGGRGGPGGRDEPGREVGPGRD